MAVTKKINLAGWILIAMVLGIVCGLLFLNNPEFTTTYIKPFGTIFINLLTFIAVPLVLLSLICSVVSMGDIKKLGSIGWKTLVFFLATTFIASLIGLGIGLSAKGLFPLLETSNAEYTGGTANVMDMIVSIFPSNMWASFMNSSMLQIIFISIVIGFAILISGNDGKPFAGFIESASTVFNKIMLFIIRIAPIGVFCLMCNTVAMNGLQILGSLALLIGLAYVAYAIHFFVVYSISLKAFAKTSPIAFFKTMLPAIVLAFSSTSSLAALPVTTECSNKAGANPEYSSFILPLGATIHKDGSPLRGCITVIFIAACYGADLGFSALFTIVVAEALFSMGAAAIPGGGIVVLTMVLGAVGLPAEGAALILGVNSLFEMGSTIINVIGDAVAAVVITRIQDGKLHE